MLVLPIPMFTALVLIFLMVQTAIRGTKPLIFVALIAACAMQSLLVCLTQYYGYMQLRPLQPVTAALIPPLAYVAFEVTARRRIEPRTDMRHLAGPAFVGFCAAFAPDTLDFALFGLFAGYGAAILWTLSTGRDNLVQLSLSTGDAPLIIWRLVGVGLILSALGDTAITLDIIFNDGLLRPWIVSLFSSGILLGLGLLSLSQSIEIIPDPIQPAQNVATPDDTDILARLHSHMTAHRPYLDPDLTLARLARQLTTPAKQVSAAINRAEGENVSRYINSHRVRHACALLVQGETVTEAMLASGFNTKSNFNREFLRVTGQTPSGYQAEMSACEAL